jgi:hypothetical protein
LDRLFLANREENLSRSSFFLGHRSVQSTERYLGCKQRLSQSVNDRLGLEDTGWGWPDLEELPVLVFSPEPADDGATVYNRMFAPVLGIPEDPGTGSASGPLGAYLLKYKAVSAKIASRLVSLQGVRMGRPSHIHIALSSRA